MSTTMAFFKGKRSISSCSMDLFRSLEKLILISTICSAGVLQEFSHLETGGLKVFGDLHLGLSLVVVQVRHLCERVIALFFDNLSKSMLKASFFV